MSLRVDSPSTNTMSSMSPAQADDCRCSDRNNNSTRPNPRRRLFLTSSSADDDDPDEVGGATFAEEMTRIQRDQAKKWNFDFLEEKPIIDSLGDGANESDESCRYEWTRISPNQVPSIYQPSTPPQLNPNNPNQPGETTPTSFQFSSIIAQNLASNASAQPFLTTVSDHSSTVCSSSPSSRAVEPNALTVITNPSTKNAIPSLNAFNVPQPTTAAAAIRSGRPSQSFQTTSNKSSTIAASPISSTSLKEFFNVKKRPAPSSRRTTNTSNSTVPSSTSRVPRSRSSSSSPTPRKSTKD